MTIVLYELQPTRSARVRWTLLELGTPFESGQPPQALRRARASVDGSIRAKE